MTRLLVCAPRRSSGKTTFSVGLCAALARRGLAVQPFKKGPDYIDPMWLSRAAGRACRNLDPHLEGWDAVAAAFVRLAGDADASVLEGNLGLHDGMAADGGDSNAALAVRLGLHAVLLLDARGTGRGIAALALGQRNFEPALRFAGVVLNRVGGARHEAKLRDALARYTDLPVLGAIPNDPTFAIAERHLGLVPSNEAAGADDTVARLADAVERHVDLGQLLEATREHPASHEAARSAVATGAGARAGAPAPAPATVRIGIARDEAFGFYYPDDLDALHAAGAELVTFDTLRDADLPQVDGIVIGGGFPETAARRLEANVSLRGELRRRLADGLPAYAECGGLMYLSRSIRWGEARHEMVGAIEADAVMEERAVGRGYVRLRETQAMPWADVGNTGNTANTANTGEAGGAANTADAPVLAHEFHHSRLENLAPGTRFAFDVLRGHGVDGAHDGIVVGNLLACYAHQRSVGANRWAQRFVAFVRERAPAGQAQPSGEAQSAGQAPPARAMQPAGEPR